MATGLNVKAPSRRKDFDLLFFKSLPGIFLVVQLICCLLGFMLAISNSHVYYKSSGHIFFLIVMFMACFSTTIWILVHFCEVKTSRLLRGLDWNKMGMIHSGAAAFFVMIGSAIMVDESCTSRSLKASGVFGFFGFTIFLVHLAWEVTRYVASKLPPEATLRAVVTKAPQERESQSISGGDGNEFREEVIMGTSFNSRPRSTQDIEVNTNQSGTTRLNQEGALDFNDSFDSSDSEMENKRMKYNIQ